MMQISNFCSRYFVIGTVPTTPWAYYRRNDKGEIIKDLEGRPILEGYVVEFAQKLSELMNIDYDLILPTDNSEDFGFKKPDGNWTGLVGKKSIESTPCQIILTSVFSTVRSALGPDIVHSSY